MYNYKKDINTNGKIILILILILSLNSCNQYSVENDAVYYKSWNEGTGSHKNQLVGANQKTFEILEYESYAKDDKLVFYDGQLIKGADALTFVAIGDFYAKDKNKGYYAGDSIENSKGKSFKVIDSYYSTDGYDIFYTTKALHVCSAKNFKFVYKDNSEDEWQRWTTDGCYYYFKELKIPSHDYKNVTLFKGSAGFAKDKQWIYYRNRKLNYNDTGKKILDTVDLKTFTVKNYLDCQDKFGCINPYHGREKCN
ncbi:hypothetical protein D3C86_1468690 [compost metagenome]